MKTLLLQVWGKFKVFLASYPKTEFTEWKSGHKEREIYKQEKVKWRALQYINMLF